MPAAQETKAKGKPRVSKRKAPAKPLATKRACAKAAVE
jgi:hypothetical protein